MGDGRISFRPSVAFTLRAASLCKIVPDDLVIRNKLKFVTNPFGAASLCLLPWMACMQILQEQKSVNLDALSLEISRSGG